MNKKRKCIVRMPDGVPAFILKARTIQGRLANPTFNTVYPTPSDVIPLLDQLQIYAAQSEIRDYSRVGAARLLRKQIKGMLTQQAAYVNAIANGNEEILSLSGFALSKVPVSRPVPEYGTIASIEFSFGQEAIMSCNVLDNVDRYQFEINGTNGYHAVIDSYHTKIKASHLPLGVELKVRVRGINRRGTGDWGPSTSFRIGGGTQSKDLV